MTRKLLSLAAIIIASITVVVGCKGDKKDTLGMKVSEKENLKELNLPIVKDKLTISYWRPNDAKVTASMKSFSEIKAYKEVEKITGIKVDFIHPPLGQQVGQFNLLMAAQDLPDVIYYDWAEVPGGVSKVLGDNKIIRLNEYIDKYAPNFKRLLENNHEIKKQCTLDDGTIYIFPFMRTQGKELNATWGFQIRKDWLDKLQLKAPVTMDDWYNVLKAFKEKDPNGNGIQDEIPFTGSSGGLSSSLHQFAPAFGVLDKFYLKGDKVAYGPIESKYKTFLETMAKWYKEKLIDQEIATNDSIVFDYKMSNNIGGSFNGGVFSGMGKLTTLTRKVEPKFELLGTQWPIGTEGKPYNTGASYTKALSFGAAISSNSKHIKEIVQYLDFGYSEQGHMLFNFGIEGESYVIENGKLKYTDDILNNSKGLSPDQALAQYGISIMDGPINQDIRYLNEMMQLPEQKKAVMETWSKADDSLVLPPGLSLTVDEANKINIIMSRINSYQSEMMIKFVMGEKMISDFDSYVHKIKEMKIVEAIEIYQAALTRYKNRN
jgi:putative aldouronate transport system substrate-binding protein